MPVVRTSLRNLMNGDLDGFTDNDVRYRKTKDTGNTPVKSFLFVTAGEPKISIAIMQKTN